MTTSVDEEVRVARHVRLNPHQVIFQFTHFFFEKLGNSVEEIVESAGWDYPDKIMAYKYVRSLVKGDGSMLHDDCSRDLTFVEELFYEMCQRHVVGHHRFKGQLQDWYKERLASTP